MSLFARSFNCKYTLTLLTHIQICKEVFKDQLHSVSDVRAVYDFDSLLRDLRPPCADKHIKAQYRLVFEVRDVSKLP